MTDAPVVDCLGKPCPMPIIDLAKAVPDVAVGADVILLADDPGAKVDIPVWCRMKGHEFVGMVAADQGWTFTVRRSH